MPGATGFQIAFLAFALQFFAMLAARALAPLVQWPTAHFELLGQIIVISLALAVLFGFPALRRRCLAELEAPLSAGAWPELLAALAAKLAIPFAAIGATVAHAFVTGSAATLLERTPAVDSVLAWELTLSAYGFVRLLLLSWFLGPVVEEIVFRGFLYRAFERQWGWLGSTAMTSALFGLLHPSNFAATALGSVILVCLLRRTGSLRACILVHAAFNVLVSWPVLGRILLTAPAGHSESLATWALPLAGLALALVAVPACVWLARGKAITARAHCAARPRASLDPS